MSSDGKIGQVGGVSRTAPVRKIADSTLAAGAAPLRTAAPDALAKVEEPFLCHGSMPNSCRSESTPGTAHFHMPAMRERICESSIVTAATSIAAGVSVAARSNFGSSISGMKRVSCA